MTTIQFSSHLKDEDWIQTLGGWRCDALRIPGAKFEALYHDGIKADINSFAIENYTIRWSGSPKPKELSVLISLIPQDLDKLEDQKIQLEQDKLNLLDKLEKQKIQLEQNKLNLEQEKASTENKWKVLTAVGAICSGLITFSTTFFLKQPSLGKSVVSPPRIHSYASEMLVSEDKCITLTTKSLENYGLQNVTPVQGGVYAIKGNYNIFIGCNASTKTAFIVVSGANDSEAKRIREDIKDLLPS